MENIISLINNIEENPAFTSAQLVEKMLHALPEYTNGTYEWRGYLGHHSIFVSKNLKELLSGNISNNEREYQGLVPYTLSLSENSSVFEEDYISLKEALKIEIEAEDVYGESPSYINTFQSLVSHSLYHLTKSEKISAGQYFYIYNSLKNTREEFVDDYI